ncbi:MAG: GAF domain-containing protein [Actinomycetota bacterium]|nr:GAF domain-containing protein [Actinomycetota bacterium]
MVKSNFIDRCEQENLHLSGKVQSGNSVAVFEASGELTDISANFDASLLGHEDVFEAILKRANLTVFLALQNLHFVTTVREPLVYRRYFSLLHNDNHIEGSILTLAKSTILEVYGLGDDAFSPSPTVIANITDNDEFVDRVRFETKLDRVMVYRFTDNEDGEVIAESHVPGIGSYLGHRYPASDVPMVARSLYLLNPWRTIRDRDGDAISIASVNQEPPDLTFSDVRSVSPFHISYMKAMGTYSSLSIPIDVDGRLWGLVSGHSESYTNISLSQLLKVKELTRRFNNRISTEVHRNQIENYDRLGRLESRIRRDVLDEKPIATVMTNSSIEICHLMSASALIVSNGEEVLSHDFDDDPDSVELLLSLDDSLEPPYVSESIHSDFQGHNSTYVGLARVAFTFEGETWNLIVFRTEEIEEITWGHRPATAASTTDPKVEASPRASFESYIETRHGHCRSFSRGDIRTLSAIARALSYGSSIA